MAKGFFSQGFCFLTDGTTTIEEIKAALEAREFEIVKQAPPQKKWQFGGPTLVISYLPEVRGYAAIDVVAKPWPDSMGDPKTDSDTFAAWSMGHFGPLTFPGSLQRAAEQSWAWKEGRSVVDSHGGFVRIRMSYAFGAKDTDPVLPEDYNPLAELLFLNQAALTVLKVPGVLCYFNPNGEVLRDRAAFREVVVQCKKQEKIPLLLWSNVRFYHVNDRLDFMDTVGNGQLDIPDVEAIFPKDKYEPGDIDGYLRNVTHYVMGLDRELKTGEEIDGPGETNLSWTIESIDDSKHAVISPPRRTLRLYPKAIRKEVPQALAKAKGSAG